MSVAMCVWCARPRDVRLRTWKSASSGKQLCGEVCDHCYYGGRDDHCRTCNRRREQQLSLSFNESGVRELSSSDVHRLLEDHYAKRHPEPRRR